MASLLGTQHGPVTCLCVNRHLAFRRGNRGERGWIMWPGRGARPLLQGGAALELRAPPGGGQSGPAPEALSRPGRPSACSPRRGSPLLITAGPALPDLSFLGLGTCSPRAMAPSVSPCPPSACLPAPSCPHQLGQSDSVPSVPSFPGH